MVYVDSEVDFSCFVTGVVKSSSYFLLGKTKCDVYDRKSVVDFIFPAHISSDHFALNWKLSVSLYHLWWHHVSFRTRKHILWHTYTHLISLSPFISFNMCFAGKISISMLFIMNIEHNTWRHRTVRTHIMVLKVKHFPPPCLGLQQPFRAK